MNLRTKFYGKDTTNEEFIDLFVKDNKPFCRVPFLDSLKVLGSLLLLYRHIEGHGEIVLVYKSNLENH